MPANREPAQEPAQLQDGAARPLSRCLSLDLEVGVKDQRIHAFAAIRPDTGQSLAFPNGAESRAAALSRLDHLAQGADFLLGHNILAFDLLHLAAAKPDLQLLNLPGSGHAATQPAGLPSQPLPPPGEALPGRPAPPGQPKRPLPGQPTHPSTSSPTSRMPLPPPHPTCSPPGTG